MKFTLSWLKDHLDTKASVPEIVDAMTMAGLEVEEVIDPQTKLKAFAIGTEMCVIADAGGERPVGLGGVMGGESTGCSDKTTTVFVESAWFDPIRTAQTSRTTGITSDA